MSDQRRTGIVLQVQSYDEWRFLQLTQYMEGEHAHYYGQADDGRMVPLTERQARQARRDGVPMPLDSTRPLQEDGE